MHGTFLTKREIWGYDSHVSALQSPSAPPSPLPCLISTVTWATRPSCCVHMLLSGAGPKKPKAWAKQTELKFREQKKGNHSFP